MLFFQKKLKRRRRRQRAFARKKKRERERNRERDDLSSHHRKRRKERWLSQCYYYESPRCPLFIIPLKKEHGKRSSRAERAAALPLEVKRGDDDDAIKRENSSRRKRRREDREWSSFYVVNPRQIIISRWWSRQKPTKILPIIVSRVPDDASLSTMMPRRVDILLRIVIMWSSGVFSCY
jgi:hypothetical protein